MGDKSPKAKQKNQKQKNVTAARETAASKAKQDGQSRFQRPATPGKK